jgi:PAS domain S-box-containing protein
MPGGVADNASAAAAASPEEQLREREQQYRRIFEATSDGLIVNDLETGLIAEVNPAFCRMHGYSYEELIGMHPYLFIHPDYQHWFDEYLAAVSEGRDFLARAREIRKDGSVFWVEVHGTTFLFRGSKHVLGVLRDVSVEAEATRLLEQRVEERTQELSSLLRARKPGGNDVGARRARRRDPAGDRARDRNLLGADSRARR